MATTFLDDLEQIRDRARQTMMEGPVTEAYGADRAEVIQLLNSVLATEVICTLRYHQHALMADGVHGEAAATEFVEHAEHEWVHVHRVAERIAQLGGVPDLNPATMSQRAHAQYVEAKDLREMLTENLIAERIAVETYSQIIRWLGDRDPTTRRMMEEILAQEEEHADDLARFLKAYSARTHGDVL